MKKYVEHLEVVDSFDEIDDRIFKLSLTVPEDEMPIVLEQLKQKYPEIGLFLVRLTRLICRRKA